jgi:dolichol-phosphate mannosyltransferase
MLNHEESWELPESEENEFSPKSHKYCVCVFVINEGNKLHQQLERMKYLSEEIDIVIADGGSDDGSTDHEKLKSFNVNTLLVKKSSGKLGAQMRMAFAWALKRGYEGVVVIDGNGKDSVEDIPNFINKLDEGWDHIQGSRFIPGGHHENTPLSRLVGLKLLHVPLMRLASGFTYTDTTNGFRAYSAKLLTNPNLAVFRDIFDGYELHYYLAVKAAKYKFNCTEIPVTRKYPATGKTPTKISPIKGNLQVIERLVNVVRGKYDQTAVSDSRYLKLPWNKTALFASLLFLVTWLAFEPGIMSPDSFHQYNQALTESFNDHHPPMMAIWWSFLTVLYESPTTLLIFHLLMLWSALYLLAREYNNNYIFLIGVLPFIINYSGVLWKDVGLAYSWLLALSILLTVDTQKYRRLLFLIFIFYGVAVRPNALVALIPILMYFYSVEYKHKFIKSILFTVFTIVLFIFINNTIAYGALNTKKVYAGPKIVMLHDLSGISKETGHNYFPPRVSKEYNVNIIIKKYSPDDVGTILWGEGDNFTFQNIDKTSLFHAWKNAISENPKIYLNIRLLHFKSLLRIDNTNIYSIWTSVHRDKYKKIKITYKQNILYKLIHRYVHAFKNSFIFTGWFWLLCSCILILFWKRYQLSSVLGMSSVLYILPYFFIGQAPDFRYIYLSIMLVVLASLFMLYPSKSVKAV